MIFIAFLFLRRIREDQSGHEKACRILRAGFIRVNNSLVNLIF